LPGRGNQGFDAFYGIPYSHEEGYPGPMPEGLVFPPVPLMASGYTFIEQPFNTSDLTSRYTSLTEELIERFASGQGSVASKKSVTENRAVFDEGFFNDLDFTKPFFMHLGYENPHVPLFLSDDYVPVSRRGLFGDSVQEMDMSIGRIVAALEANGLAESTLVIFTSDNGAWVNPSNGLNPNRPVYGMGPFDGGSNAPFKEGKGSTWEGGFRVPLVVSLPNTIPANQIIRTPVTAMDFLPTILDYAGIGTPDGVVLDGKSIKDTLEQGDTHGAVHECIYLWRERDLYAIRCGQYKAHFITRSGFDFSDHGTVQDPPLMFNVEWDPSESFSLDVADPAYAAQLKLLTAQATLHLNTITKAPSEYLAQNMTRAPCCPRDAPEDADLPDGPWKDCICTRITNSY
jgi:arylsulfatase A